MKKWVAAAVLLIFLCGCAKVPDGRAVEAIAPVPSIDAAEETPTLVSSALTPVPSAPTPMPSIDAVEETPTPVSSAPTPMPSVLPTPAETIGVYYAGSGEKARYLVAIDAGHQQKGIKATEPNGPGASVQKAKLSSGTAGKVTRLPEYKLNLTVALALRDELLQRGYSVYMIRTTNDAPVSNKERAEMANAAGADVFLRIHANGSEDASVSGAMMVCISPQNPYTDQYAASRQLSEAVLEGYCRSAGIPKQKGNTIWETDTMTGMNWCQVPSTTLEMGYMSNSADDLAMAEESFAPAAARGIADGIDAYFMQ